MNPIPFQAGDPVTGDMFFNREEILSELLLGTSSIHAGRDQDFAILSMRRVGKSSLLRELQSRLRKEDLASIYVDCSKMFPHGLLTIIDGYAQAIWESYGEVAGWEVMRERIELAVRRVPDAVSSLIRKAGLEAGDLFKVWVELREKEKDLAELFEATIDLPEKLAQKTGIPAVILLDEFQILFEFNSKLMWSLRAKIQQHSHAAYVVSGSATGMLTKRALSRKAPFYGIFVVRRLDPFDKSTTSEFLSSRIRSVGMQFDPGAIDLIYEQTAGIPFYVQWLGLESYFLALHQKKNEITSDMVEQVLEKRLKYIPQLEYDFAQFSPRKKQILLTMAMHGLRHPAQIARKIRYPTHHVIRELRALEEQGYVVHSGRGDYSIGEKLFERWVARRFMEEL